jgi:hypothetical protein
MEAERRFPVNTPERMAGGKAHMPAYAKATAGRLKACATDEAGNGKHHPIPLVSFEPRAPQACLPAPPNPNARRARKRASLAPKPTALRATSSPGCEGRR